MNILVFIVAVMALGALTKAFSLSVGVFLKNRRDKQKPPQPPVDKGKPGKISFRYCPNCKCTLEDVEIGGKTRKGCKACGYVNWNNPIPVAVAVIPYGDGYVSVRRKIEPKAGMLAFPGGFLEPNESPEAGAVREAGEETGLEVVVDRLLKIVTLERQNQILFFYLMRPATGQKMVPGDDAEDCLVLRTGFDTAQIAFPTHLDIMKECLPAHTS